MVEWLLGKVGAWIFIGILSGVVWCIYRCGYLIKRGFVRRKMVRNFIAGVLKAHPNTRLRDDSPLHGEIRKANLDIALGCAASLTLLVAANTLSRTTDMAISANVVVVLGVLGGYFRRIRIVDKQGRTMEIA